MKKVFLGVLLLAFAAAPMTVVVAESDVSITAEVWSRTEYIENWTDFRDTDDTPPASKDNIDFTTYRARVNLGVQVSDDIGACVEIQNFGTWGDAFLLSQQSQDPALGTFDVNANNDVQLYQAYVDLDNIGGSMVSLQVGRQEHTLGNELHMGDNDFYGGQYFDGIRADLDFESWAMTLFYYKVQERSLAPGSLLVNGGLANGGSDDSDFFGVHANFDVAEGHKLEPYVLGKKDGNELGSLIGPKYNAMTVGILYDHARSEDGMFDWSVEVAMQSGEVFGPGNCPSGSSDCDLSSMVAEGHFGVSFGSDNAHRVHVGMLMLGDGDDAEDREDFMELFPDTHRRAGAMDLFSSNLSSSAVGFGSPDTFHNLTNIFVGWDWTTGNNTFSAALHQFTLTEDFGGPEDDIGQEIDLMWQHMSGEHVGFTIGVSQFMPGDLFTAPNDDDAMRAWGMLRFRG